MSRLFLYLRESVYKMSITSFKVWTSWVTLAETGVSFFWGLKKMASIPAANAPMMSVSGLSPIIMVVSGFAPQAWKAYWK